MADLPADLIERAARAIAPVYTGKEWRVLDRREAARAALEAVADHWPTPTARRDQLAEALTVALRAPLFALYADKYGFNDAKRNTDRVSRDVANLVVENLAAGVLRDATQVETEARADERAKVAEEIMAADNAILALERARRIARDTTAGTT